MKKEKFFQTNVVNSIPTPTEDELKLYYNKHKKEFFAPSSLNLVEYSASYKKCDERFFTNQKEKRGKESFC